MASYVSSKFPSDDADVPGPVPHPRNRTLRTTTVGPPAFTWGNTGKSDWPGKSTREVLKMS